MEGSSVTRVEELVEGTEPIIAPLALAFRRATEVFERETGVSAPRWFVLKLVERNEGIGQGEVCQRFRLDPSRVTRIAQTLEADGLIRRERDPEDNRVVRMYLTGAGQEALEGSSGGLERFERRVRGAMSEEELAELRRLLGVLWEAMMEGGEE